MLKIYSYIYITTVDESIKENKQNDQVSPLQTSRNIKGDDCEEDDQPPEVVNLDDHNIDPAAQNNLETILPTARDNADLKLRFSNINTINDEVVTKNEVLKHDKSSKYIKGKS